ncbi:hypothetical protein [Mesorhizobium sp. M0618]|uniref:hypothetical protein n=1 Tax=unclassified Mesorhizobium TaxID=325217 RepID=UPI00333CA7BE
MAGFPAIFIGADLPLRAGEGSKPLVFGASDEVVRQWTSGPATMFRGDSDPAVAHLF